MEYIARQIQRTKWKIDPSTPDKIGSDALSGVRITNNSLSTWEFSSDRADIEEVVLAYMTGGPDKIEAIDILLVKKQALEEKGYSFERTAAVKTAVDDLRGRHLDISNLLVDDICTIAKIFAPYTQKEETCVRFSIGDIKEIIARAKGRGRVNVSTLNKKIKEQMEI